MTKEVVIVGGGFGGVRTAQRLARSANDIHITLIEKELYHSVHPSFYEIATANVLEHTRHLSNEFRELLSTASYPLIDLFKNDLNVTVVHGIVSGVNFKNQRVLLEHGASHAYDALVLAVGSETNYFNIAGMEERAMPLKTLWNALAIRNQLDEVFARTPKYRRISIVVGGGGFTGCEFAAELVFFIKKLERTHGRPAGLVNIAIIEASPTLMGGASSWVQRKARERLEFLGIHLMLERPITGVAKSSVFLNNGEKVLFDIFIWTAGVRANSFVKTCAGVELSKNICLCVDKFLRVVPYENVFSVGDATYCVDDSTGKSHPMTATVALEEGNFVAGNIQRFFDKKSLIRFEYVSPGFIIPLGGKYALVDSRWIRLSGFFGWVLKHVVILHYWTSLLGVWRGFWVWTRGMKIFVRND